MFKIMTSTTSTIDSHHARIHVIGPPKCGKTTLIYKIITGQFNKEQFKTTNCLEINECKIQSKTNAEFKIANQTTDQITNEITIQTENEITISFWDFSGCMAYSNIYPLFFTNNDIYMILFKPTLLDYNNLEKYFINIRSKAPNAYIILVTSYCEEISLDEIYLQELKEYNYVGYYPIDSESGKGINNLLMGIQNIIINNKQLFITESKYMTECDNFKNYLNQLDSDNIFQMKYSDLLNEYTKFLATNQTNQTNQLKTFAYLLHLFNKIGYTYVIPKSDFIILNTKRLIHIIKNIFNANGDKTNSQTNDLIKNGILDHDKLRDLYPCYNDEFYLTILHILYNYHIAYELHNKHSQSSQHSIIPFLFKMSRTQFNFEDEATIRGSFNFFPNLKSNLGCYQISFNNLLPNLFSQLIVSCGKHMKQQIFEHGNEFTVSVYYLDQIEKSITNSVCHVKMICNGNAIIFIPYQNYYATNFIANKLAELLINSYQSISFRSLTISFLLNQTIYNVRFTNLLTEEQLSCMKYLVSDSHDSKITNIYENILNTQNYNFSIMKTVDCNIEKYKENNSFFNKIMAIVCLNSFATIFNKCCLSVTSEKNIFWFPFKEISNGKTQYFCVGIDVDYTNSDCTNDDCTTNVCLDKMTYKINWNTRIELPIYTKYVQSIDRKHSLIVKNNILAFTKSKIETFVNFDRIDRIDWIEDLSEIAFDIKLLQENINEMENMHYKIANTIFGDIYCRNECNLENIEYDGHERFTHFYELVNSEIQSIDSNIDLTYDHIVYKVIIFPDIGLHEKYDKYLMFNDEIKKIIDNMKKSYAYR